MALLPACLIWGLLICLATKPFVSSGQAEECPRGWLSHKTHCYGYFPQELTWRQAQAQCQRHKASLASILDADEHHALADFLRHTQSDDDDDVWIGFSVSTQGQGWAWVDGSPVSYTAWERFEPSPYAENEHCAQLDEDSGFMLWDDESCDDQNPFLCKL